MISKVEKKGNKAIIRVSGSYIDHFMKVKIKGLPRGKKNYYITSVEGTKRSAYLLCFPKYVGYYVEVTDKGKGGSVRSSEEEDFYSTFMDKDFTKYKDLDALEGEDNE